MRVITHHPFEMIAEAEPSFESIDVHRGRFQGRSLSSPVEVFLEPSGWVAAILPLPEYTADLHEQEAESLSFRLLRIQQKIDAPVKFVKQGDRYCLMGEIPPFAQLKRDDWLQHFNWLRSGLSQWQFLLNGSSSERTDGNMQRRLAQEDASTDWTRGKIKEYIESYNPEAWSESPDGYQISIPTENYLQRIQIQMGAHGSVLSRSPLVEFQEEKLSDFSRMALSEFLLRTHRLIRLARASLVPMKSNKEQKTGLTGRMEVVLEAVTRGSLIESAVSSLIVAGKFCALEVRALLDEKIASAYLNYLAD